MEGDVVTMQEIFTLERHGARRRRQAARGDRGRRASARASPSTCARAAWSCRPDIFEPRDRRGQLERGSAMPPMLYVLIFLAVVLAVEGFASLVSERRSGARATARKRLRQIALGHPEPGRAVRGLDPARAPRGAEAAARPAPGSCRSAPTSSGACTRRVSRSRPRASRLLCVAIGLGAWFVASIVLYNPRHRVPVRARGLRCRSCRSRGCARSACTSSRSSSPRRSI